MYAEHLNDLRNNDEIPYRLELLSQAQNIWRTSFTDTVFVDSAPLLQYPRIEAGCIFFMWLLMSHAIPLVTTSNSSRLLTEQLTEPIIKPFVRVQTNVHILYKRENPMASFPNFLSPWLERKVSGKKCPMWATHLVLERTVSKKKDVP